MRYARFERIIVLVIAVAVAAMAVAMAFQKTDEVEILGHLLMIAVIVSSLYGGKRGAVAGFLASLAVYAAARLVWRGDFCYVTALELVGIKLLVYGVLALLCDYIRIQFRYFFVKMERQDLVDDETQIGNERFLARELQARIDEHGRYQTPFSLVRFSLDGDFVKRQRREGVSVMRDLSISVLKNDTRSVDELARMGDEFVVILPNVGREGAEVCRNRLQGKISAYIERHLEGDKAAEVLRAEVLSYPEDRESVEAILSEAQTRVEAG
ncbi:MAG: diguanylate cyclase [Actinobacteria bacterium]|nr:diguanylate cyclase [Actinomycetota bacterium]MDI6830096.1 diguanylate cyclase [Actinomycetota bacterium]